MPPVRGRIVSVASAGGARECGVAQVVASVKSAAAAGSGSTRMPIAHGRLAPGVYVLGARAENSVGELSPAAGAVVSLAR